MNYIAREVGPPQSSDASFHDFRLRSTPAAFTFLREMMQFPLWTSRIMADSLCISVAEAERVIGALELQGYVKSSGCRAWFTTPSGRRISETRRPTHTQERVEIGLFLFSRRIAKTNRNLNSPCVITRAVAFGDFLWKRPRAQAAEIGIQLGPRSADAAESLLAHSGGFDSFLKWLKGRGGVLRLWRYETWMSRRTHIDLLQPRIEAILPRALMIFGKQVPPSSIETGSG